MNVETHQITNENLTAVSASACPSGCAVSTVLAGGLLIGERMRISEQMKRAKEAGLNDYSKQPWIEDYKHHCSMVENPLPFGRFQIKYNLLTACLKRSLNDSAVDREIHALSLQLGY
jgi:hypothetical protein